MSKRKLLLADDSITIQKVVNLTFADEGVEVITVGDGNAAVEKIIEVSPDVVLADIHMPGLNGYQVCEWTRANPQTKELPVILLVGSFEPFDEGEAARVGANAYLTKPFQSIRQLVSQVTDLMPEPQYREEQSVSELEPHGTPDIPEYSGESDQGTTPLIYDTNDIDSLYHQSFGDAASPEKGTSPVHSVDPGMDDEMIETAFGSDGIGGGDETARDEQGVENEEEAAAAVDASPTDEMTSIQDAPASNPDYGQWLDEFHYNEQSGAQEPDAAEFEHSQYSDLDRSIPDQGGTQSEHRGSIDRFTRTDEIPEPAPQQTESFGLDETDLLDLPPIDAEKTIEFKTAREVVEQEADKQVVTLSPELLETIVAKVVERLSKTN